MSARAWMQGRSGPVNRADTDIATMIMPQEDKSAYKTWALPAVALGLGAVMLLYNAFRYSLPMGYAGLYAQASQQIAQDGFRLPLSIHFYGPGEVPFAYPPLAFYAMALGLDLGVSPLTYLRLIPALLSLLGLIPLYLLTERLTQSRLGAAVAVGLCAASPVLYAAHTWAAGIVRALAFLLLLSGLYFFDRAIRQERWLLPAVSGALFGLVVLTHLSYALFLAICLVCWLVTNLNPRTVKAAIISAGVAAIVIAPWAYSMISRYGATPFLSAWSTHGNESFLAALAQPSAFAGWVGGNLGVIMAVPLLMVFVALGLAYLAAKREFTLPLLFLVSVLVLSPEGDRFIAMLAAVLAGASSRAVGAWLPNPRWLGPASQVLLGSVVLYSMLLGFRSIRNTRPQLQEGALQLATLVQRTTSTGTRFLILAAPNEAEWFPFLLQREPLASKWGAEWLGTYYSASGLVAALNDCRRAQDVGCLQALDLPLGSGDILITHRGDKTLTAGLESQTSCPQLAAEGQYLLWNAACLIHNPSAEVTP